MQTYIVLGVIILAAGYVGYTFLRRLGFWGTASGCGCGCEGCPSFPSRKQGDLGPNKSRAVTNSGSCVACAATDGCSGQTTHAAPLMEIKSKKG